MRNARQWRCCCYSPDQLCQIKTHSPEQKILYVFVCECVLFRSIHTLFLFFFLRLSIKIRHLNIYLFVYNFFLLYHSFHIGYGKQKNKKQKHISNRNLENEYDFFVCIPNKHWTNRNKQTKKTYTKQQLSLK